MNILLHLHPQGAYIARAINFVATNYPNSKLLPVNFPSFLEGMNTQFSNYLLQKSAQKICIQKYKENITWDPQLLFKYKNIEWKVNQDQISSNAFLKSSKCDSFITKSIIDTASRNLLFSSEDYFRNLDIRDQYNSHLRKCHDKIFTEALKLIYKQKVDLIIVSHMNYIYYTAMLLAAYFANIPVLLLHGGYNETILFKSNIIKFTSPSDVRKDVLDKYLRDVDTNVENTSKRIALYDSYRSISDMAQVIYELQQKNVIDPQNRLALVNHQVISEICFHFEPKDKTQIKKTRYDILELVLRSLISKNVSVILRTHPASRDYPGEIEIVKNLLAKINSPLIKLSTEKETHNIEEEFLSKNLYPEIYSLGGSATCELISQGIHSYSIGECQMPDSCQQFVVPVVSEIEAELDRCYRNHSTKPNRLQMNEAASFLKLAKLTYHRRTKFNADLERADTFFHFGNIKDHEYTLLRFLQDSIDSKLTSEYSCHSTLCNSTNLYFNEK